MWRRARLPGRRHVDVDLTQAPDPADNPAEVLAARVRAGRTVFRGSTPVPHLVIDDALPVDVALRASFAMCVAVETAMIPPVGPPDHQREGRHVQGVTPHSVVVALALLESASMRAALREVTGRPDLTPDSTHAAGTFEAVPGGRPVRLDGERPPPARLAVTLLLFASPGWRSAWGGSLALTGPSGTVSYVPRFNRLVMVARAPGSPVALEPPTRGHDDAVRLTIVSQWFVDEDAPIALPDRHR